MRWGLFLALAVGALGLTGMLFAFLSGASPYVDVAQAKVTSGDSLHLAGAIVPGTIRADVVNRRIAFELKDDKGAVMPVVYQGPPPSNIDHATRVVAVGAVKNGEFHSNKLLLKCPSKYESTNTEKARA